MAQHSGNIQPRRCYARTAQKYTAICSLQEVHDCAHGWTVWHSIHNINLVRCLKGRAILARRTNTEAAAICAACSSPIELVCDLQRHRLVVVAQTAGHELAAALSKPGQEKILGNAKTGPPKAASNGGGALFAVSGVVRAAAHAFICALRRYMITRLQFRRCRCWQHHIGVHEEWLGLGQCIARRSDSRSESGVRDRRRVQTPVPPQAIVHGTLDKEEPNSALGPSRVPRSSRTTLRALKSLAPQRLLLFCLLCWLAD